jgi:hypothetical protein
VALAILALPGRLTAQEARRLFPARELLPHLLAGPRDPATSAKLVGVTDNPTALGDGVEMEVSLGVTLPLYLLAGLTTRDGLVVGVEAAAFARFGLQVLERELVATDWVFAVPFVWHRAEHWFRLRYYHTSSHLGDEYARRFDVDGENFARDGVDVLAYLRPLGTLGLYGGARWDYSVHPEDSGRWTVRAGAQIESTSDDGAVRPFAAVDLQSEQDTDWSPRLHLQVGLWLPKIGGRRALRAVAELLTGPSPLGQFQGLGTTQIALGVCATL